MRRLHGALLALTVAAMAAGGALAQPPKFDIRSPTDPSRGNALNNTEFKGPEVLKFIGVKKGDRVADIFSGRFTTALAGVSTLKRPIIHSEMAAALMPIVIVGRGPKRLVRRAPTIIATIEAAPRAAISVPASVGV